MVSLMHDDTKKYPIILSGGSGTRMWPLSRSMYPKQFLSFGKKQSLLQRTLKRAEKTDGYQSPILITNEEYRFTCIEQSEKAHISPQMVVLEPTKRSTAPAICAAAIYVAELLDEPDALLHVMPSDHHIPLSAAYKKAVSDAEKAATAGHLVTFGITPTHPATGFGYIKEGKKLGAGYFEVNRFVEKPAKRKAQSLLKEGGYYWNSGMFMFKASTLIHEMEAQLPEMLNHVRQAVLRGSEDSELHFLRLHEASFAECDNVSIDVALFEKTDKAAIVPSKMAWSDIGSWKAFWETVKRDEDGNYTSGDVKTLEVKNSLIVSEGQHVSVQGLSDVTVVSTPDAVYVGKLSESESVKELVSQLSAQSATHDYVEMHRKVYRPWGGYESVLEGERFQVKRLFVKPGKKLSLQMHHHRAEHWIVVRGTAEVSIDGDTRMLLENQSTYIPPGSTHRLYNPGKITLELIEVQSGAYLGEDDIIRLEDDFGRE